MSLTELKQRYKEARGVAGLIVLSKRFEFITTLCMSHALPLF